MDRMQRAYNKWSAGLQGFSTYEARLRYLASGAAEQRKAALLGELIDLEWNPPEETKERLRLGAMLEPDVRPGPPELWVDFDAAVEQLDHASASRDGFAAIAAAFGALSTAANSVADGLADRVIINGETEAERLRRAG